VVAWWVMEVAWWVVGYPVQLHICCNAVVGGGWCFVRYLDHQVSKGIKNNSTSVVVARRCGGCLVDGGLSDVTPHPLKWRGW